MAESFLDRINPLSTKEDQNWLSKLDAKAFLALYDEWKASKSSMDIDEQRKASTLFGKLRQMHQGAGKKNENIFWGRDVENEMDRIADMVRKGQEKIVEKTKNDVAEVKEDVNQSTVEKLKGFSYTINGKPVKLTSIVLNSGMRPTLTIELSGDPTGPQRIKIVSDGYGGFKVLGDQEKYKIVPTDKGAGKMDIVTNSLSRATPPAVTAPTGSAEGPAPRSVGAPTAKPSTPTQKVETKEDSGDYNQKFLTANKAKFDEVISALEKSSDENKRVLAESLRDYVNAPHGINGLDLQEEINDTHGKRLTLDGHVGPASLKALADIAGVDYVKEVANSKKSKKTASSKNSDNGDDTNRVKSRYPETKESTEKRGINKQIDEVITRMLKNSDFVASGNVMFGKGYVESPFNMVAFSSEPGTYFVGDLQMSHGLFHAYEEILTGKNLDAWRKLTPQEKQTIIDSANKKWNDRAQSEVSKKNGIVPKTTTTEKRDKTRESAEANRETIIAQANARMDEIIGNENEFLKDFTNQTYGYPRVLENPFSEVNVATKTGVIATDLQLRDNSLIPTAYEYILTGDNLSAWRKMNKSERSEIITHLNILWGIKSQQKISAIEARGRGDTEKKETSQKNAKEATPRVAEATPRVVEATPRVVEATPRVVEATPRVVEATPRVVSLPPILPTILP